MRKTEVKKMPQYFDRYINLTDDVDHIEALAISLHELENFPKEKWEALGDKVYAPGKWTAKDILQHYIDTERVFTYRMTAFARNDKQTMLPFDEEKYAQHTNANNRTINDLLDELILVRKGYIALYKSFTDEMLMRSGKGFNGTEYCVLSMAFMIAGHQRWHIKVVEEKYYSLLEN
jgi:DinB superfamily